MKALILAAGQGTRIAKKGNSKPLINLGGLTLIERVIKTLSKAGVDDIYIVTGFLGEKVEDFLKSESSIDKNIQFTFIRNDEWERENGLSVLKAKDYIREKFLLLMSDHIFDVSIVSKLLGQSLNKDQVILAVDRNIKNNIYIDIDDVTKVLTDENRILEIGKRIKKYNAFDTGIFLCTSSIFDALESSIDRGDFSLSGGMSVLAENKNALVMDIGKKFWIDVDDEESYFKAEKILNKIPKII